MLKLENSNIESRIIESSNNWNDVNLYSYLVKSNNIKTRLTQNQLDITRALELLVAVYNASSEYLDTYLETITYDPTTEAFREKRVFSNKYALFIASEISLRALTESSSIVENNSIGPKNVNFAEDRKLVTKNMTEHFMRFLTQAMPSYSDETMKEMTSTYIHSIRNASVINKLNYYNLFDKYPELSQIKVFSVDFDKFNIKQQPKFGKKLTFDYYIGQTELVQELKEFATLINNRDSLAMWGARFPKGFILAGNPGVGKTYLARIFADECGLPFTEIKLSDILDKYYGTGSQKIAEYFSRPGVIFVDEADSLGRAIGDQGTNEATEQIVNTMKQIMDGLNSKMKDPSAPITLYLCATNNLEIMDPALTRAGRLKPVTMVDYLPNELGQIFSVQKKIIEESSTGVLKIFEEGIDTTLLGTEFAKKLLVPADIEYIAQDLIRQKAYEQALKGKDYYIPPITQAEILTSLAKYEKSSDAKWKNILNKTSL